MSRIRSWFTGTPVTEAAPAADAMDGANAAPRRGYEYGVAALPVQTSAQAVSESQERLQILTQLHQAYLTCPWVSAPVDLIARTVTAGGLQIVYQTEEAGKKVPAEPPPVQRLRRLMRWVNPREDMVQLLRQTIIDLKLFGDAYIEVVRIAGEPVALYTLDATTMSVVCDPHGDVTGYVQSLDGIRKVEFEPDEVIHISLDAPRGGIYGVSPAQKALLPVTAWLFTEATIKENFRQGDPPRLHVDLGSYGDTDVQRWREQYKAYNLGPKAVGTPLITTKKGEVQVLDPRKVTDYLAASKQLRDEIIATFGVPPAKLGIIESGNLGGGTGESQDKALDLATPIPTPTGWTTMGELRAGDQVLDEQGKPCNVIGTYEVPDAESWRLSFSDGTHIDCCSDHLWTTWTFADRKAYGRSASKVDGVPENWPMWKSGSGLGPATRRTADLVDTLRVKRGDANHSIPVTAPLNLPDTELPVEPYVLGAWLGDGTSVHGSITIGRGDEQILDEIRSAGFEVRERPSAAASGRTPAYGILGLIKDLRAAGVLGDKHVPAVYLRASAAQRLALLQGLMDTDGGFSSGQQVLFRSKNERLADAVVELARSLGQKPVKAKGRATMNGIDCGVQFSVTWTPTIQVFRLARKADRWNPAARSGMSLHHRRIVDAVKIPDRPMRCIRVDSPNALYLAGEAMIPTHNTFRVDTIIPVKALVLEKLNYHIVMQGFGIMDWAWEFGEIDYRDSKVVEEIRDMRLRNGSMTRNQYADEIGNPPVDGGDVAVLVDRQNIVLWNDMAAMSKAMIAGKAKGSNLELDPEQDPQDSAEFQKAEKPAPPVMVAAPPSDDGTDPNLSPDDRPGGKNDAAQGEPPKESAYGRDVRKLSESWERAYRARRRQALKELPEVPK